MNAANPTDEAPAPALSLRHALAEVLGVFAIFFLVAAALPPDVNEAHYLGKARHYWDPTWCTGDLFLESADAHRVFYWTFGWVAYWLPLPAAAWLGRVVTWLLLAWAWQRLSWSLLPARWWSLLTAGWFAVLLHAGHMAGEWVLGGVEAKGFAYVLLLLALRELVRNNWNRLWLLLGAASSFHVLVGGWAVVAGLLAWCLAGRDRPRPVSMLPSLLCGLLLASPGLLSALWLSAGVDSDVQRAANQIYVYYRLSHHLVFHRLEPAFVARHAVLVLLVGIAAWRWRRTARWKRLLSFVAGAVVIAAVGILIDAATRRSPHVAAALLRFYWFRLSDVMIPLAASLLLAALVRQALARWDREWGAALLVAAVLAAAGGIAAEVARTWRDPRPPAVAQAMPRGESRARAYRRFRDWQRMCYWVRQHVPPGEIVLTPRQQQGFKWYSFRGEVVNWKDVPQDAAGIVRWYRTMQDVYPQPVVWRGLGQHGEAELIELGRRYGFRHIVIDRSRSRRLNFQRVFPAEVEDVFYEVYRLPDEPS